MKVSKTQLCKMIQSGGILAASIGAILQVKFHTGIERFKKAATELAEMAKEILC